MKKFWPFIGGVVTGIIITFVGLFIYAACQRSASDDVVYFEKPGDAVKERSFKVFQVLEPGVALVNGVSNIEYDIYTGPVYVIVNDDNKYYSDEEVISLESDEVARKVGVYNYRTKGDLDKTVSIIKIVKK